MESDSDSYGNDDFEDYDDDFEDFEEEESNNNFDFKFCVFKFETLDISESIVVVKLIHHLQENLQRQKHTYQRYVLILLI